MKLIINNSGTRDIINLDQTVKVYEVDETQMPNQTEPLYPYRIMVLHLDGTDEIIYQTDEKFECSTVMASIIGATEEGKLTHTINTDKAVNANAIVRRAKNFYDGTNYITTIKLVREMTGWGLKEAKRFCDDHIKDPALETSAQAKRAAEQQKAAQGQRDAYREQAAPVPTKDKQRKMWEEAYAGQMRPDRPERYGDK
jgi:ribosomal protein L7/L12